jgi:hypothetical protein
MLKRMNSTVNTANPIATSIQGTRFSRFDVLVGMEATFIRQLALGH